MKEFFTEAVIPLHLLCFSKILLFTLKTSLHYPWGTSAFLTKLSIFNDYVIPRKTSILISSQYPLIHQFTNQPYLPLGVIHQTRTQNLKWLVGRPNNMDQFELFRKTGVLCGSFFHGIWSKGGNPDLQSKSLRRKLAEYTRWYFLSQPKQKSEDNHCFSSVYQRFLSVLYKKK